ncbi:hypothetical protein L1O48_05175 [Ligilactobacillus equi]|uniref:Uncharacterized protein n=1 Tax=Ligilactobacillus equi DSM 15833 = JCM 10991 TaxID=1423740 RepID=A0A0R1TGL5_9LACO|nr:hypothetical protein [Ligilactobacillus equi]KRL80246.1 hypothetical protein FC36_GL000082 [Ligilactobacillus equi DSM 15833 = JCM 10991]
MSRVIFLGIIALIFLGDGLYRAFDLYRYYQKVQKQAVNFSKGVTITQTLICVILLVVGIILTTGTIRMFLAL